jgi:hypothetical protein
MEGGPLGVSGFAPSPVVVDNRVDIGPVQTHRLSLEGPSVSVETLQKQK